MSAARSRAKRRGVQSLDHELVRPCSELLARHLRSNTTDYCTITSRNRTWTLAFLSFIVGTAVYTFSRETAQLRGIPEFLTRESAVVASQSSPATPATRFHASLKMKKTSRRQLAASPAAFWQLWCSQLVGNHEPRSLVEMILCTHAHIVSDNVCSEGCGAALTPTQATNRTSEKIAADGR